MSIKHSQAIWCVCLSGFYFLLSEDKKGEGSLVGASLSEPHTSVAALQDTCVCPVRTVWPNTHWDSRGKLVSMQVAINTCSEIYKKVDQPCCCFATKSKYISDHAHSDCTCSTPQFEFGSGFYNQSTVALA